MKSASLRFAFPALLVAVLTMGLAAPAQAQLGIAGGLNYESADDIQISDDNDGTLDNSTGYHLGLIYELDLGPAALRPGFFYRRVGTFEFSDLTDDNYEIEAWQVPVDLRLSVLQTEVFSPYLLAGTMVTFPRSEGELDDAMEDATYSINVGVGASFSMADASLQIQPEVRYEYGATKFIDEDADVEIGGSTIEASDQPSFNALGLRLNIVF